jgi:polyketide biosynthesis 3-hydroxy-3-methylglutaryl-CoA synthase-like enzyme PksG
MMAGIEALNVFAGTAVLDLRDLARRRGLDPARFENLLMKQKAVALPHEDPVTFAANAARPLVAALEPTERERIELLITCSESGVDFSKSLSTYVHHYLGLSRHCRLFEIKQACYSGTAGLQMAVNFVLSQTSPGARALVVATDIARFSAAPGTNPAEQEWAFAEPSSGAGAVALLVGERPQVLRMDVGASGCYGYEVMDTCRPDAELEAGDTDLSLLTYLDCCEQAFLQYQRRVSGAHYRDSFQHLIFHTPFAGMVKGAHRTMMRRLAAARIEEIEADFAKRVAPGLTYCQRIGNIMGGALFVSLAATIDRVALDGPRRIGCFSYGSGCCSEFFSGVITPEGQQRQRRVDIESHLNARVPLEIDEYEALLHGEGLIKFGTRHAVVDAQRIAAARGVASAPRLALTRIRDYHREYEWLP